MARSVMPFHFYKAWTRLALVSWGALAMSWELGKAQDPPREQTIPSVPANFYPYGGPSWAELMALGNPFSSRSEVNALLNRVFCDPDNCEPWLVVKSNGLLVMGTFIPWNTPASSKTWRTPDQLPPVKTSRKPLGGIRIGIDPGHLGGKWAKIEQRETLVDGKYLVREGTNTRIVGEILAQYLRNLGAEVLLLRDEPKPLSPLSPAIVARNWAQQRKSRITPRLQREANLFFVRRVEINARAAKLRQFQPDLTICLHFDAGAPNNPVNKLHLLLNGSYSKDELADPELRWGMLSKLLGNVHPVEAELSAYVAASMSQRLDLPPFTYSTPSTKVKEVPGNDYLWCRNLLANCLYPGPVVYTEPFAMLNTLTARRMALGDYPGYQIFSGQRLPSIYREYARSVADGIKNYFVDKRMSYQSSTPTHHQ